LLHESVGGEWSFIETLRHLVFATDSWIRRAILGDPISVGSPRPAMGRDA
jgi:DinB superfamily